MPIRPKQLNRLARQSSRDSGVTRPLGITISGTLMVIFGLAEVVTGFTHNFLGIGTSSTALFTFTGVLIGAVYAIAGAVILTMKKWAAILAVLLLIADILGRVTLTITGLFPTDSFKNTFAIVAGTLIAAFFAVYIGVRMKLFR